MSLSDELYDIQAKVMAWERRLPAYKQYYEADKLVSQIYDEVSPGINTPFPENKRRDHSMRLNAAIEKRKDAERIINVFPKD